MKSKGKTLTIKAKSKVSLAMPFMGNSILNNASVVPENNCIVSSNVSTFNRYEEVCALGFTSFM
jgi:hypothetical protein